MGELTLRAPTLEDFESVRHWRNEPDVLRGLRTPYMLTKEMQERYYREVVCDRNARCQWWAVWRDPGPTLPESLFLITRSPVGLVGLESIEWENRLAEITLIIDPAQHGKGYGKEAVRLALDQAFNHMNLETVWGECYKCSLHLGFWEKVAKERMGYTTTLPRRKFWKGRWWDSLYFSVHKGAHYDSTTGVWLYNVVVTDDDGEE